MAKAIVEGNTGVTYAIGISEELPEKEALAFATNFYRLLFTGRSVEEAFEVAIVPLSNKRNIHLYPKQNRSPLHYRSPTQTHITSDVSNHTPIVYIPPSGPVSGDTLTVQAPPPILIQTGIPNEIPKISIDQFRNLKDSIDHHKKWTTLQTKLEQLLCDHIPTLKLRIIDLQSSDWASFPPQIAISTCLNRLRDKNMASFPRFYEVVATISVEAIAYIDASIFSQIFHAK